MLTEYNHKQSESNKSELNQVANELTSVSERISKVIHLVSESGISIETVKDELKQLEERKQYLSAYFNELSLKNRTSLITEEMILDLINKSKEFVKTKNIAECRNFITNYVEKVVVYNEHVEIIFKINVPDDDNEAVIPLKSEEAIKTLQKEYKVTSLI